MAMTFSYTIDELPNTAEKILQYLSYSKILLFEGDLGAGKTTLIKEICKKLNVADTLSSPSFSIVNEYQTIDMKKVYHFDLYRIKSIAEAEAFGIDDYIFSGEVCLVEWPQKIDKYWNGISVIKCNLEVIDKDSRKISIFMV